MVSETIYLKDKHADYLQGMIAETDGIENISQAVQYCVNQQAQRDDL